jgi:UDP-N-acetylglucosamine--N-acetylmuramyl-(pentapeptide) pyrophosphoryl-undecaprenol N-acetylglucosamine transferase
MRILFTGGGTGGHIYPILAIAEELKRLAETRSIDLEMRYFGAPANYQVLLENAGIRVSKILSSKLRRYFDWRNFVDIPIYFPLSIVQSLWKVFWYMPDVLFSKGGPGALAVVLVCRFYRIPAVIHESDAVPGLTNQLSSRYAQKIIISFESAKEYFGENVILAGNPVRQSLLTPGVNQEAAKTMLGFAPDKPLLLFISGSQGASRINDFVLDILPELIPASGWQVFHQAGLQNFEIVKREFEVVAKNMSPEEKMKYKVVPYLENNLKEAYLAADVVVSRASSSIFEFAAFGKPTILIPLPEAVVGNHQIKNAYEYAETGAAIVMEENNLKPNIFLTQVRQLIANPEKLRAMSEAAKKFAKPEAAKIIAEEIIKLGSRG